MIEYSTINSFVNLHHRYYQKSTKLLLFIYFQNIYSSLYANNILQVDQAMQDIQIFIEKTMLANDPRDEKLAQFRQHAAVIANNKQLATEQYMEMKEEFGLIYRQIEEKESELQNIIGRCRNW